MTGTESRRITTELLSPVILAFAMASSAAHAVDAKGTFALHGIGALTCGEVNERIKTNASVREQLAAWLLGYVSATNRVRPDTYDITPIQQPLILARMVENVCASNAGTRLETATYSLLTTLAPAGAKAESPLVKVQAGENFVELRQETLKAVQQALIDRKFLKGKTTGEFGKPTETALGEFQKAEKLSATNLPDPATLMRLLIEKPVL